MGKPAGIVLFINQNVVRLRCSQAMAPDLHWAVVVVEFYIEEAFAVGSPDHRAVGLLDDVVKVRGTFPVAHTNRKIFRALDVRAPGLKPVIRRMPRAAELEIFMVRRKLIAIEHDFDRAAVARNAAEHLVLTALAEFAQIGIGPIRRGHAGIVLLDPPAHFRNQGLLQAGSMAEQAFGIVVFRFEISADIGVQDRGIAQHFLPVLIL